LSEWKVVIKCIIRRGNIRCFTHPDLSENLGGAWVAVNHFQVMLEMFEFGRANGSFIFFVDFTVGWVIVMISSM